MAKREEERDGKEGAELEAGTFLFCDPKWTPVRVVACASAREPTHSLRKRGLNIDTELSLYQSCSRKRISHYIGPRPKTFLTRVVYCKIMIFHLWRFEGTFKNAVNLRCFSCHFRAGIC